MTIATLKFDLDNEHEREVHDAATNGWRYKKLIDCLIKDTQATFFRNGVSVSEAHNAEDHLKHIKKVAQKLGLADVAAQTGLP